MTQTTTDALRPQVISFGLNPLNDLAAAPSDAMGSAGLRFMAISSGLAILGAATFATTESGKLAGPDAGLAWALAGGVAMGAVILPRSKAHVAAAFIAALVCGEAFNLLSTAERIVTTRDNAAATTAGLNERHTEAAGRLRKAEVALSAQRDTAAEAVTLPTCAKECRALLQSQSADISAEIEAARKALNAAPPTRSVAPLADRLGVAPWALDLLAAALLSIGANGLGAVLIAWGASPGGTRRETHSHAAAVHAPTSTPAVVPAHCILSSLTDGTSGDHEPPRPPRGGLAHPVSPRTRGLLSMIEGNGGTITGPQRDIAQRAGISKTALNRLLAELAASGVVIIETDRVKGTRIALKAA